MSIPNQIKACETEIKIHVHPELSISRKFDKL